MAESTQTWFVRTTTAYGATSITYGPDKQWARDLALRYFHDMPDVDSVETGLTSKLGKRRRLQKADPATMNWYEEPDQPLWPVLLTGVCLVLLVVGLILWG